MSNKKVLSFLLFTQIFLAANSLKWAVESRDFMEKEYAILFFLGFLFCAGVLAAIIYFDLDELF